MLFPRNLFIDKDWKALIPTFTKAGKQYLDVDKYGRFSILYINILKLKMHSVEVLIEDSAVQ